MPSKNYLFISICLTLFISASTFGQNNAIRIGYLHKTPGELDQCGTRLKFAANPDGPNMFVSADDEISMKLNGEIVKFEFLESNEIEIGETEVGKFFWRKFNSNSFTLKINFKVIEYSDNSVSYQGMITIKRGKSKRNVKFVGISSC